LRVYPKEGPMPRTSEAPLALAPPVMVCRLVRCSKSWTTSNAGRGSPCRVVPRASRGRRRKRCQDMSSHGNAPQKPNCHTPRAGFSGGQGFRRHLLSCGSVCTVTGRGKPSSNKGCDIWYVSLRIYEIRTRTFILVAGRKKTSQRTQETE
jgi:hypothetical protein